MTYIQCWKDPLDNSIIIIIYLSQNKSIYKPSCWFQLHCITELMIFATQNIYITLACMNTNM